MHEGRSVYVVDWDLDAAAELALSVRAQGWPVEVADGDADSMCRRVANCLPLAAIVSLDRDPDLGCDLACRLVEAGADSRTPIIFVGGTPDSRDMARELVDGATFVERDGLADVLRGIKGDT